MSAADAIALARRSGFKLAVDGDRLEYEVPAPASPAVLELLRLYKAEAIDLLLAERRAIVTWISDHFRSSPLGLCAHCGEGAHPADQFVALFVGEDQADIHTSCHPEWIADREVEARIALGIETPKQRNVAQ